MPQREGRRGAVPTVGREELRAMLERGAEVTLVDALPEAAYRRQHLPGAINIPSERIRELAPRLLPRRDAGIVVYCGNAACRRSEHATRRLLELGYTRVRDYHEGREDWAAAGLPLATAAGGSRWQR